MDYFVYMTAAEAAERERREAAEAQRKRAAAMAKRICREVRVAVGELVSSLPSRASGSRKPCNTRLAFRWHK